MMFVSQVKANCSNTVTHTFHSNSGVAVRRGSNIVQVSNQNGASVSCDLSLEVCSFTLDGWLHGRRAVAVLIFVITYFTRHTVAHIHV